MNELLDFAVEAQGGLERWRRVISITARLSIGGLILVNSGWESAPDNIAIRIDTRDQRAVLSPFIGIDRGPTHDFVQPKENNTWTLFSTPPKRSLKVGGPADVAATR